MLSFVIQDRMEHETGGADAQGGNPLVCRREKLICAARGVLVLQSVPVQHGKQKGGQLEPLTLKAGA